MTSATITMSLNVHAWLYQRLETIAIFWDSQRSEFQHISDKKRLLKWAINTFLATVIGNACCIYIIVKEFTSPKRLYPFEFLLVQLSFIIFASFWSVVFISANLYGNDFVAAWNGSRKILLKVRKQFGGKLILIEFKMPLILV